MTPFLSRLLDRSAAAPHATPVLPVVPPLFAAGATLEPGVPPVEEELVETALEVPVPTPTPFIAPAPTVAQLIAGRDRFEGRTAAPAERIEGRPAVPPLSPTPVSSVPDRDFAPRRTEVTARLGDAPESIAATPTLESHAGPPTEAVSRPGSPRTMIRAAPIAPKEPALPHRPQIAELAPIVRVTIGRIEVRAVTPPASTSSRTPAAAAKRTAIVLEDYLRSRSPAR
jgi:hypothetical protein